MKINVHAGHNPDGEVACGTVGLIKESTEARNVVKHLIEKLKDRGHTVYDCTINDGNSQGDILKKIVAKCNSNDVDIDLSIHFNAGVNDEKEDGNNTGTESYVYSSNSEAYSYGKVICEKISELGYKNRGVKLSQSLYFLNNTKAQAILIKCCFVDNKNDTDIYSAESMAEAIADALGYKIGNNGSIEILDKAQ